MHSKSNTLLNLSQICFYCSEIEIKLELVHLFRNHLLRALLFTRQCNRCSEASIINTVLAFKEYTINEGKWDLKENNLNCISKYKCYCIGKRNHRSLKKQILSPTGLWYSRTKMNLLSIEYFTRRSGCNTLLGNDTKQLQCMLTYR